MKSYAWSCALAECYEQGRVNPKHEILAYPEWFVSQLQADWTIMDIGCNNGHMVEFMAAFCRFVYGIEIAEVLVREAEAKRTMTNVKYFCADAIRFDYTTVSQIDCISLSNVLEHIDDRVDFLRRLVERVPWRDKMNIRILIRVPLLERDWLPVFAKRLGLDYRLDSTHQTEYRVEEFQKELEESGLRVEEHYVRYGELYAVCSSAADYLPTSGS